MAAQITSCFHITLWHSTQHGTQVFILGFRCSHASKLLSQSGECNGAVVAWKSNYSGYAPDWDKCVAVGVGTLHSLAPRTDRTVVSWGCNTSGQTDVPSEHGTLIEGSASYTDAGQGWSDVISLARRQRREVWSTQHVPRSLPIPRYTERGKSASQMLMGNDGFAAGY